MGMEPQNELVDLVRQAIKEERLAAAYIGQWIERLDPHMSDLRRVLNLGAMDATLTAIDEIINAVIELAKQDA